MMHILRHIVDGIRQFGPVYSTWMFSYEGFNSWLHWRVMNRRWPEATLMETYRVNKCTLIFIIIHIATFIGYKYTH